MPCGGSLDGGREEVFQAFRLLRPLRRFGARARGRSTRARVPGAPGCETPNMNSIEATGVEV